MTRRCFPGHIAMLSLVLGILVSAFVISCEKTSAPPMPAGQSNVTHTRTGAGAQANSEGASLATDKADYLPGETATITGSGFDANEDVSVVVTHADGTMPEGAGHQPWTVTADESGGISTTWTVCSDDCFGSALLASADGQTSGTHAEAAFTDGLGSGYIASVAPNDGGCVHKTVNNDESVESWDVQQGKSYTVTLANITECSGETIQVIVKSSESGNTCVTATSTGNTGEYTFDYTMPANACNTLPILYCTDNCNPNSGYFVRRSDGGEKQAHLRAWTFGLGCDWDSGSADTDCGGGGDCNLTIECPSDVSVKCASEVPAADITAPVVTSTSECGTVTVDYTETRENEQCVNQFDLLRTYTATGSNGGSASCTQTIHVFDDVAPVVSCPADIAVSLLPGDPCLPIVNFTIDATDNCGTVHVVANPPSGSPFPVGTTTVTVTVTDDCGNTDSCSFDVVVFSSICAVKFYDANVNGVNDDNIFVPGWQINLGGAATTSALTGSDGRACFPGLYAGDYTVSENVPGGWIATTNTSFTLNLGCPQSVAFGNICLGPGGGKTLGYWSNKNGAAQINDGGTAAPELALLTGLCLRNANGSDFDPATVAQLQSWLLAGTAVNMANMLSVQLAAMELNVEGGAVKGTALVYAPCCGNTGVGNQFISINDLMQLAAASLCADANTTAAGPARTYQECLKTALDRGNNNLNFVQAAPCSGTRANSTQLGQ